jgi:hypothetical protein
VHLVVDLVSGNRPIIKEQRLITTDEAGEWSTLTPVIVCTKHRGYYGGKFKFCGFLADAGISDSKPVHASKTILFLVLTAPYTRGIDSCEILH